MTTKNTVPSAPEDMLDSDKVFANDGRKREDANFVGAKTPDTDAEEPERASEPKRAPKGR